MEYGARGGSFQPTANNAPSNPGTKHKLIPRYNSRHDAAPLIKYHRRSMLMSGTQWRACPSNWSSEMTTLQIRRRNPVLQEAVIRHGPNECWKVPRAGRSDQLPRMSALDRSCRWNVPKQTVRKALISVVQVPPIA